MTEFENALESVPSREISKVAALDIGSNSFHLVIARIVAGSVQILHRVKQKVRLADGLTENNQLSEEAIQRGLSALEACKESMQGFEPDTVRIVATHTLRLAKNAREFINAARAILPYPVEIISGVEEARLIYQGVAHTLVSEGKRLVIDIGGGSTEFIIGEGFEPILTRSVQMGCVNYTNQFFSSGELTDASFASAILAAQQHIELLTDKYCALGWTHAFGSSGTIRTIASLQAEVMENSEGEHLPDITREGLEELIKRCCEYKKIKKLGFEQLSDDRKPVLAAGLAILMGIFKSLKLKSLTYSPAALREGVIYEMEERLQHHDIRQRTAHSIATRYDVDTEQAIRVLNTTRYLYEQCKSPWDIKNAELKSLLGWASLLHEVGLQINSRSVQKHSAYILRNADLPGFNQEQQALLATLVACHRKKIRSEEIPHFQQFSKDETYKLIALLRIGVLLNLHRQDDFLPEFQCQAKAEALTLHFPKDWLSDSGLLAANLETEAQRLKSIDIQLFLN
ncbi:exopolyphosphatase [Alteromonas sp. a30]|uniref:exopolyphosphatase n=1 Tax=Alteromonas sp. a30 TaxID=2730917 RepID=UPI002281D386|nr:exopolyphosphatase [Alteromonas sp. a30]MCY7296033.1 exopolyphosphatase [Alteromonas sp. a30]